MLNQSQEPKSASSDTSVVTPVPTVDETGSPASTPHPLLVSSSRDQVRLSDTLIVVAAMFLIIAAAMAWNVLDPISFIVYNNEGASYAHGTVTKVVSEHLSADSSSGQLLGDQVLEVRIDDGPWAGSVEQIRNGLTVTRNIVGKEGLGVVVRIDESEGAEPLFMIFNYNRLPAVAIVGAMFAALMLIVGRTKGLRSLLGLAFAVTLVVTFLLPAIYRGLSPILLGIVTALLVTASAMALLNGLSKKTLVCIASAGAGMLVSMGFYFLFTWLLNLSGYNTAAAEDLVVVQRATNLHVGEVLFVGVLIASLGAVIDMCMSVASPLFELKHVSPGIGFRELIASGMAMGRDMIGTMCQTLILAFVGSAIGELLLQISYGSQPIQLISSDYIAIEVLQSFAGGAGVILVVPVTALFCAWALCHRAGPPAKSHS